MKTKKVRSLILGIISLAFCIITLGWNTLPLISNYAFDVRHLFVSFLLFLITFGTAMVSMELKESYYEEKIDNMEEHYGSDNLLREELLNLSQIYEENGIPSKFGENEILDDLTFRIDNPTESNFKLLTDIYLIMDSLKSANKVQIAS